MQTHCKGASKYRVFSKNAQTYGTITSNLVARYNKGAFKTVGNMHNVAYIAGVVGLIIGVLYNTAYRIFCDIKALCAQKNGPEIRG